MRVNFHWCEAGCCRHPEFVTIQGGGLNAARYPSNFGRIKHPTEGWILYDTGYSKHFSAATRPFPERLYGWLTPVELDKSAAENMIEAGVAPADVRYIVISHFHGDHIAGLRDFPNARFICLKEGYENLLSRSRFNNVLHGHLPKLLPPDFDQRVVFANHRPLIGLAKSWSPFTQAYDLLGDGSLLGLPLPGHSIGQMGLILRSEKDREILLAADAVWHSESIRSLRLPHSVTRLLHSDFNAYKKTVLDLNQLAKRSPNTLIIPTHCREFGATEW